MDEHQHLRAYGDTDLASGTPCLSHAAGGTEYIDLDVDSSSHSVNLSANGGSQQFTLEIEDVPDFVAVGTLQVKFDLPLTNGDGWGNNGTAGNYASWERVYLVYSQPDELQEVPWTDFLEWSCRWAFGASDLTEVKRELTRGMHYSNRAPSNRVRYNPAQANFYWTDGSLDDHLDMDGFLDNIENSFWTTLDCRDFAAVLQVAFHSHGLTPTFDWIERWENGSRPGGFYTWPLCPAGADSRESGNRTTDLGNYVSYPFNFHCVVGLSDARFDSSASYLWDPDGSVWENPVWEWDIDDHWQKYTSGAYRGFAYGLTAAAYPFSSGVALPWHIASGRDPIDLDPSG